MKYKVVWNSPRQGIQSTTVDALGPMQAEEQVESMYAHIDGFRINHVTPVFEKQSTYTSYSQQPIKVQLVESSYDHDFSAGVAGVGLVAGGCLILYGFFTFPSGIGAMILGGAVGWLSWKAAMWLADRDW